MAQFDVYRLRGRVLVVDVQSETLQDFSTRVVVPLHPRGEAPTPATRLHPLVDIEGERYVLATHLLTAVPARDLGAPFASLEAKRYTIIAALDMVLTGY